MQFQYDSLFSSDLFLVISVHQESQSRTIRSRRGLDDIGNDLLLGLFVEILEGLAAELGVLFEIIVRAIGDSLELAPAHGEKILDIDASFGIVGQFVRFMLALSNVLRSYAVALVPLKALVHPLSMPFFIRPRHTEKLDLHLLELTGAERKIAGRDLISERFTDLGDSERQFLPRSLKDIVEVDKDSVGGFRPEINFDRRFLHRTERGFEHQACGPWLRELSTAAWANRI